MNKVILIGNLARDPELKQTGSGTAVCQFTIAVQRRFANAEGKREADFLNVIAWRQLAENCARYLAKGRKAAVEGSIQTRSYDAQDGSKRYVTEIIADSVEFLSPTGTQSAPLPEEPPAPVRPQQTSMNEFQEIDDDELPF